MGCRYNHTTKAVRCGFCGNELILEFQTKSMPCGFLCRSLIAGWSAAKSELGRPGCRCAPSGLRSRNRHDFCPSYGGHQQVIERLPKSELHAGPGAAVTFGSAVLFPGTAKCAD